MLSCAVVCLLCSDIQKRKTEKKGLIESINYCHRPYQKLTYNICINTIGQFTQTAAF